MESETALSFKMKTLCVVAAVLSLATLSQSASLACQNLTKPLEQGPDVSGTWHFVALSSSQCVFTTLINSLLSLSYQVTYTPTGTANISDCLYKSKVNGLCANMTVQSIYQGNRFFATDMFGAPQGSPEVMLHTGCTDCMVIYINNYVHGSPLLMLLSKRQTVSETELTEFNTQAECLGWAKPIVLGTDHDYGNCQGFDEDHGVNFLRLSPVLIQRLTENYQETLKCISDNLINYPSLLVKLIRETFQSR